MESNGKSVEGVKTERFTCMYITVRSNHHISLDHRRNPTKDHHCHFSHEITTLWTIASIWNEACHEHCYMFCLPDHHLFVFHDDLTCARHPQLEIHGDEMLAKEKLNLTSILSIIDLELRVFKTNDSSSLFSWWITNRLQPGCKEILSLWDQLCYA